MPNPVHQADAYDVVVVGAGPAGLTAAHHLTRAGLTVTVLEATHRIGGRMTTDDIDGFRLDRIGRPLLTSYPELRLTPALFTLRLRRFAPGVLLHADGRVHRAAGTGPRSTGSALPTARALPSAPRNGHLAAPSGRRLPHIPGRVPGRVPSRIPGIPILAGLPGRTATRIATRTAADRLRLGAALTRLGATPPDRLLARPDRTAAESLATLGFPPRTVDGFLRPLLTSLLCDPDLTTSSRCADLALHAFATGRLCVPEGGADALPAALAAALPPGTVRTGVRATAVSTTSVTTRDHGELRCRAVVVATSPRAAAELLPGLRVPGFHPVTVLHHATDEPPLSEPALLLDATRRGSGRGGPVAHTAVLSQVDPSRAPAGRALVTSTVLGAPPPAAHLDATVRTHLARLYGTSTTRWELLAVHHTPDAVPAMPPPHDPHRPVRLLAGLYICGDHRDSSTVQGALHSGRRAAHALLADVGARPARTTSAQEPPEPPEPMEPMEPLEEAA